MSAEWGLYMKQHSSAYKWTVLAILMVGTAILYYSNMIFAVRAPDTMAKFAINEGQLAAISTIGCLPGAFLSVVVGRVLDRKGVKLFTAAGLILTVACMVWRIFAHTYIELMLATVLIGAFLLPVTIVGPKMVGGLFRPDEMPLALGFFGAAGGLGTTLAFATGNVYPSLEAAFTGVSILGGVLLLAWLLVVREPAGDAGAPVPGAPVKGSLGKVLKSANMWKVMFCSGFAVGSSILINTYLTQAFSANGASVGMASSIGTVLNLCLIIGGILSGAVIGKVGKINVPYAFICIVGGAFYLLAYLLPISGFTYVLVALGGLVCSGSVAAADRRLRRGEHRHGDRNEPDRSRHHELPRPDRDRGSGRQQLHHGVHPCICVPGDVRHRGYADTRAGRKGRACTQEEIELYYNHTSFGGIPALRDFLRRVLFKASIGGFLWTLPLG